jgi:hypothetical protein
MSLCRYNRVRLYFTLPGDGFFKKKTETRSNVIYGKFIQNINVIDCFYFSIFILYPKGDVTRKCKK